MAMGSSTIAHPFMLIPNNGAKTSIRTPFNISAPAPNVKVKNGRSILVKIGQRTAFTILMNKTNSIMSSKSDNLTPSPK